MSKRIRVSLSHQLLIAYEGNKVAFEFDCATGDREYPTNVGHFRIFRKHCRYTSRNYKGPMNFAMFFTNDGKAIHKIMFVWPVSMLNYLGFN